MPKRISGFCFVRALSQHKHVCLNHFTSAAEKAPHWSTRVYIISQKLSIFSLYVLQEESCEEHVNREMKPPRHLASGQQPHGNCEIIGGGYQMEKREEWIAGLISWLKLMGLSARMKRSPAVGERAKLFSSLCFNSNCYLCEAKSNFGRFKLGTRRERKGCNPRVLRGPVQLKGTRKRNFFRASSKCVISSVIC